MSINCDEALLKTLHIKVADIALKIVLEIIVHRQPADRREEILRLLEKTMTASEHTLRLDRNVIPDISLVRNRKTLAVIETKRCAVTCQGQVADFSAEEVLFDANTKRLFAQVCFRPHELFKSNYMKNITM